MNGGVAKSILLRPGATEDRKPILPPGRVLQCYKARQHWAEPVFWVLHRVLQGATIALTFKGQNSNFQFKPQTSNVGVARCGDKSADRRPTPKAFGVQS